MTAAQRLRLVLALGVINLVLASVALGIGITGAPFATPGIAVVEPTPAQPGGSNPGGPSGTSNPSSPANPQSSSRPEVPGPEPSSGPGSQPTPTPPEPSPSPSIEPSPSLAPSEPPAATPPTPGTRPPVQAANPDTNPATSNGGGGPRSTPTPPAKPPPAPTPVTKPEPKPTTCHASSNGVQASKGKACGTKRSRPPHERGEGRGRTRHATHPGTHHATHHATQRDTRHSQPATVEAKRRSPASRHRLRRGHRPR